MRGNCLKYLTRGGEKENRGGGEETKFFKKGVANWVKVWVS